MSIASDLNGRYYVPSGKLPAVSIVFMLLAGIIAPVILGIIYGYLTHYNPFIYINFLATIGFAVGVGVAVLFGASLGKARNPIIAGALGLFGGFVALYFGWAFWIRALSEGEFTSLNLLDVWHAITVIGEKGAWSLFRSKEPVSGIILWILWGIEAVVILGGSALMPYRFVADTPFCEECDCWTDEEEDVASLECDEEGMLKMALEQEHYEALTLLPAAKASSMDRLSIDTHVCPECKTNCFLTVQRAITSIDKDGKEQTEKTGIVENLNVPPEVIESVKDIRSRAPEEDVEESDDAQMSEEEMTPATE